MSPRVRPHRGRLIPAFVACFYIGLTTGWLLHAHFSNDDEARSIERIVRGIDGTSDQIGTTGSNSTARATTPTPPDASPVSEPSPGPEPHTATSHKLRVPIDGLDIETLKGGFAERRDGGSRPHEAVDILAPRNTPVHAVTDGAIAKLFLSKAGGITIYQFDADERYCYYYAHLQRYADGLREGQRVMAGDVIGYVGTTGNAPPNTPHLHLAVFELTPEHRWWDGKAVDPYLAFKQ